MFRFVNKLLMLSPAYRQRKRIAQYLIDGFSLCILAEKQKTIP